MKKYQCEDDLKEILSQLSNRLAMVEVKGDSVEQLFASRLLIKQLYEKTQEIAEGENAL